MNNDILATIGVGVALFGLFWRMLYTLRRDLDVKINTLSNDMATVKERLSHIEGWIQGRFREGTNG